MLAGLHHGDVKFLICDWRFLTKTDRGPSAFAQNRKSEIKNRKWFGVPSRTLTSNLEFRTLLLCVLSYGDKQKWIGGALD